MTNQRAVDLLIDDILPEHLRGKERSYDKKGLGKLLKEVAEHSPEEYGEFVNRLKDIGREQSYLGGETIALEDMRPVFDREALYAEMDQELAVIQKETKDPKERLKKRMGVFQKYADKITTLTTENAFKKRNKIYNSVVSGARGNPTQFRAMISTPGLYTDYKDEPIPMFVRRSFGDGVRPIDMLAGSFGVRKSILSTKNATADAGDLCLGYGTLVRMADGSVKEIQDICVGDMVLGSSKEGVIKPVRVTAVFEQGKKTVFEVGGIYATKNHKFLTTNGIKPVSQFSTQEQICSIHGNTSIAVKPAEQLECYDIEVDHPDHLFVLGNGFITSNSKQLYRAAIDATVTADRAPEGSGILLDKNDSSLFGRVLAREVAGHPRGTIVTREVEQDILDDNKISEVLVHSPLSTVREEGIDADSVGLNFRGQLPQLGYLAGLVAGSEIGEPLAQCLEESTLVKMADGSSKPIKEIEPGDYVLGSNKAGIVRPTKVLNVFDNGVQECVEIQFKRSRSRHRNMKSIICTPNHRHLTTDLELRSTDSLCLRDKLMSVTRFDDKNNRLKNVPEAKILGLLVGDGCINGGFSTGGIGLSAYDSTMVKDLEKEIDNLGLKLTPLHTKGEYRVSMKCGPNAKLQKTKKNTFVRNTLKLLLTNEDLWGKTSKTKSVPKNIYKWNNNSVFKFLAGYFAADGCCDNQNRISFSSISKELITHIKNLLETRLGVVVTEIYQKRKKRINKPGEFYDISYTIFIAAKQSVIQFNNLVGPFVPGVKQKRLKNAVNILKDIKEAANDFSVTSIADAGMHHVYDIEVDHPDHLFVLSNGLITHNSGLNSKHTGGAYGGAKKSYSGFKWVNQFVQSPEVFEDEATLAEFSGRVERIEPAPQGGNYVWVEGKKHFVLPELEVEVKPGDEVERGDQLSSGLANPREMVRLRGLGEGRRYYVNRLKQMLDDSGLDTNRRTVEIIARGALDHVKITDPDGHGPFNYGDVASYNKIEANYQPSPKAKPFKPSEALNKYLEKPVLHYTIGTQLTPKMAAEIERAGFDRVLVSDSQPGFEPTMVRLREAAGQGETDWLARTNTSYLKKNLIDSAVRGYDTNVKENINPFPRIAVGEGFAENIEETGRF